MSERESEKCYLIVNVVSVSAKMLQLETENISQRELRAVEYAVLINLCINDLY